LQTREYFIAAEPEVWDYVPFGGEMCGGSKVNFSDNAKTFLEPGPDRIGNKYLKALYVEYTDATFKTRKVSTWQSNLRRYVAHAVARQQGTLAAWLKGVQQVYAYPCAWACLATS
jgi:hypothetical protein